MKSFIFFLLLALSISIKAQDERFSRRILSGDLVESEKSKEANKVYHYMAKTPLYELDLQNNAKPLALSYERRDGENWIYIYDSPAGRKNLFKGKLETMGKNSNLFRISVRDVSPRIKVLILYFYEGYSQYLEFNSSARLYYLTMEDGDANTLTLSKGPFFFQEREQAVYGYYRRNYQVDLFDYNKDGIKEIVVKHGQISRVSMYVGKGEWREL